MSREREGQARGAGHGPQHGEAGHLRCAPARCSGRQSASPPPQTARPRCPAGSDRPPQPPPPRRAQRAAPPPPPLPLPRRCCSPAPAPPGVAAGSEFAVRSSRQRQGAAGPIPFQLFEVWLPRSQDRRKGKTLAGRRGTHQAVPVTGQAVGDAAPNPTSTASHHCHPLRSCCHHDPCGTGACCCAACRQAMQGGTVALCYCRAARGSRCTAATDAGSSWGQRRGTSSRLRWDALVPRRTGAIAAAGRERCGGRKLGARRHTSTSTHAELDEGRSTILTTQTIGQDLGSTMLPPPPPRRTASTSHLRSRIGIGMASWLSHRRCLCFENSTSMCILPLPNSVCNNVGTSRTAVAFEHWHACEQPLPVLAGTGWWNGNKESIMCLESLVLIMLLCMSKVEQGAED